MRIRIKIKIKIRVRMDTKRNVIKNDKNYHD